MQARERLPAKGERILDRPLLCGRCFGQELAHRGQFLSDQGLEVADLGAHGLDQVLVAVDADNDQAHRCGEPVVEGHEVAPSAAGHPHLTVDLLDVLLGELAAEPCLKVRPALRALHLQQAGALGVLLDEAVGGGCDQPFRPQQEATRLDGAERGGRVDVDGIALLVNAPLHRGRPTTNPVLAGDGRGHDLQHVASGGFGQ